MGTFSYAFRTTAKYKATVTDECGNQTTYGFEIETSVNGWLIDLITVGVLVLAGSVTIIILKKNRLRCIV